MFDDKTNKPNPMAPANLPTTPQKLGREPEDILDTIDEAPDSPVMTRPQPSAPAMPVPPAMPKAERATSKEPFAFHYKKFVVIIVGVLLLAGLAWGGWYAYNKFMKSSGSAVNTNQAGSVNQNAGNTNQPIDNINNVNTNQPVGVGNEGTPVEPKPIDSDSDGLDDEEEKLYGTNPDRVDTDLDGLTDRDEVKVFKTDPNNPDSDGDTFLDGNEVRAGYDPKGDGKLLEITN